jgi:PII-like signaling protein
MTAVHKFTAYLAERERVNGRFAADELLDLITARRVHTSIVLRGIASFGPRGIVRTDESLTLSEDLPVAIAAVDRPDVIGPLLEDATALVNRGLFTVERAQSTDGAFGTLEGAHSVKLTLYVGRRHRVGGVPAYAAACQVFHRLGFAGAISHLGVDGTVGGERRRSRFFSRNADVPMMIVAIGSVDQAAAATAELTVLLTEPLLTVERIRICRRAGQALSEPHTLPTTDADGRDLAQKLMVLTDEDARRYGQPIHRALVRRLRESRHVSGATVLRGLWGFSDARGPHGDRMLSLGRRVPVATIVVGTPQAIAASYGIIDELTGTDGLVTSEVVPAALALGGGDRRGSTRMARHRQNEE